MRKQVGGVTRDRLEEDLVAAAGSAGWGEQEVIIAISDVCDHLALSKAANDELLILLKEMRRRAR
tara:strand:- start:36886 stop:37080 length:195 start_codon:yes stop_codon:yes gene_type:complete